jgi:hypothetical protein
LLLRARSEHLLTKSPLELRMCEQITVSGHPLGEGAATSHGFAGWWRPAWRRRREVTGQPGYRWKKSLLILVFQPSKPLKTNDIKNC